MPKHYTPMMPCSHCDEGVTETWAYNGPTEVTCNECDGAGEVDASACEVCDCRTDLYDDGDCPACDAATLIIDNSPGIHKENYEALQTLICNAIGDILYRQDWSRPVDPKIHLNGGDPFRDFIKKVA